MLRTVTAATVEPVTLAEAKAHLRVLHAADDELIGALISAARETVESNTGVALAGAAYIWSPERAGACNWRPQLPLWPATIQGVTYWDGNSRVPLVADDYRLEEGRLTLGTILDAQVAFTTVPDVIPAALKAAILLLVGDMYANTEATAEKEAHINPTVASLIWPHRRNLGV